MDIRYIESKRRTLSLQVAKDGSLILRMPIGFSRLRAERFIREKSEWIEKTRAKMAVLSKAAALPYSAAEIKAFTACVRAQIPALVDEVAKEMGVDYGKIRFRKMKTRWGSCSSRGDLTFNMLLGAAPTEVVRSVVVHELAHRKQMNHSRKFYAVVAEFYPNYNNTAKWLKTEGKAVLLRAFP